MDLEKKLQQLKARYNELNAAMSDPGIFDDPENYTKLTKERSDLEEVVLDFDRYTELKGNFKGNIELIEMNEDPEITEMAVAENKELKAALARLEDELKIIEQSNQKFKDENENLKAKINDLNDDLIDSQNMVLNQNQNYLMNLIMLPSKYLYLLH